MRRAPLAILIFAGCLDVTVPDDVEVACVSDDACFDGAVCSPLTDRCVPPGEVSAPALSLRVEVLTDRVTLNWTAPAATQVTGIVIERDGNLVVARLDPTTTSVSDETVEFDTLYRYALRLEAAGERFAPHPDDTVEVLSAPAPVGNLRAVAEGLETILTWEDANSVENVLGHRVTRDGQEVAVIEAGAALSFVETLVPDSEVTYGVQVLGAFSGSVVATAVGRSPPEAPVPVTVSTVGATELSVSWADTSAHEDSVIVERLVAGVVEQTFELGADEVALSDTGLTPGVDYTYRVTLVGPAGPSPSAEASDRTSRNPIPVLSGPVLDDTCTLTLVGDPGLDTEKGALLDDAEGVSVDSVDVAVASASGVTLPVTEFDRPGWNIDWTVRDDLGGASTLSFFQPLTAIDQTQTDELLPMLTAAERSQGHQLWDPAAEIGLEFPPGICGGCSGGTTVMTAGRQRCFTSGPSRDLYCMGGTSSLPNVRLVEQVGLSEVHEVVSSHNHACAVAGPTRATFCWGQTSLGRLGDGSLVTSVEATPVAVCRAGTQVGDPSGPACEPLEGVVDLTAGKFGNPTSKGTCALLDDGTARCWGKEEQRNFGNGAGGPADDVYRKPVPICADALDPCTPLDRIVALEIGPTGGCAIRDDGQVLCWGQAALIRGPVSDLPTETMPELTGAIRISLGGSAGCAVMPDSTVLCFGNPRQGASGDGDIANDQQDPLPVCATGAHIDGDCVPLTGAVDVVVTTSTACALLEDRTMRCWGQNNLGKLGTGLSATELPNTGTPQPVCSPAGCPALLDDIVSIDVANDAVCAVDMFGKAFCWGGEPLGNNEQSQNFQSALPIQVCTAADCGEHLVANVRSCFEFTAP